MSGEGRTRAHLAARVTRLEPAWKEACRLQRAGAEPADVFARSGIAELETDLTGGPRTGEQVGELKAELSVMARSIGEATVSLEVSLKYPGIDFYELHARLDSAWLRVFLACSDAAPVAATSAELFAAVAAADQHTAAVLAVRVSGLRASQKRELYRSVAAMDDDLGAAGQQLPPDEYLAAVASLVDIVELNDIIELDD